MKSSGAAAGFQWWGVLFSVWVVVGLYAYARLDRGWVPHDEGQFGLTAERALAGEIPHRDFDEMYTGGLTYLNALALEVLGRNLYSLRLVLFACFLTWVPVVFYVASRFGSPLMAGALTALAAVWTIPNYSAPVPSWYNLFFGFFGVAAMLRYLEAGGTRWLFVAGLFGGLSFLIKLVGLYYVAGVLLFLVYLEQGLAREIGSGSNRRERFFTASVVAGLLLFLGLIVRVFQRNTHPADFALFTLPTAAAAGLVMWRELRQEPGHSRARFASLLRLVAPFLCGVTVPIVVYLLPYLVDGNLGSIWEGVFVLPQRRISHATYPTPSLDLIKTAPMLLFVGALLHPRLQRLGAVTLALAASLLGFILVASAWSISVYQLGWKPVVFFLPLSIVVAVLHIRRFVAPDLRSQGLMLLVCVTALCSLVQFPFPAPIYFCFVAPFVVLTLGALFATRTAAARTLASLALVFYLAFAVVRVTPGFIYAMGRFPAKADLSVALSMPRAGGLRVFPEEAQTYDRVVAVVSVRARSEFIYAFPDCPEMYFLTGLRNPTRTVYDFLADDSLGNDELLRLLAQRDVHSVVINSRPSFSALPSPELLALLRDRFPYAEVVERFEVRWRE